MLLTLVLTVLTLCSCGVDFVVQVVKLLLDEIEPLGHTGTTARHHGAMVVYS